ncbi:hypothetical protein PHLGIDRAFT_9832 [Phlebiopsis gigantea 11061_1 CR5-6]|uniref:AB hydrolase-1 domain-containing protein n=1 Tax=Phlebiopsis gigantea (strain 11061_1 CR5-6) TaxID=745531 RepID=A0A0C3P470_PHLG1|nr:hypothetical protein PHLGIDRAFT_9832 [Phlebiopsis gigantea 11061_1 CR5-6]
MPTAPVDDKGNYVYYEDSGAPEGAQDYVTVVIVHGSLINSAHTDEELDAMSSPDVEAQACVVRGIGQDIANFVAYVCKTKGVPRLVRDGEQKTGGVVLMTWSRGNIGLLSILGDPRTLEGETKDILSLYVRKMVLYDPPTGVYGIFPDIGMHYPMKSTEYSMEQKPSVFAQWVSSYYQALPAGTSISAEALRARPVLAELPPTLSTLTPEEFARTWDGDVFHRSNGRLTLGGIDEAYRANFRRAFLDAGAVLPEVGAVVLWCDRSIWACLWGVKVLEELLLEEPVGGKKRPVRIMKLENANHFVHWDEPERMVRLLKEIA